MITIYPDDETKVLWAEIKKLAHKEGKSASDVAREAFRDYIKKHGNGNPAFVLEKWIENPRFKAFPTLGDEPNNEKIQKMDKQDLDELIDHADRWARLGRLRKQGRL